MCSARSEASRRKILQAAQAVLIETGVNDFTVEAVAARSGSAKTTIYRQWPSAGQLLIETIGSLVAPFPTPNTGSLRGDLLQMCETISPTVNDENHFALFLGLHLKAQGDQEFELLRDEFLHERLQPMRTIIELAQLRGEIRSDLSVAAALEIIEGPFLARRLFHGAWVTPEQAPEFIDNLLAGLR